MEQSPDIEALLLAAWQARTDLHQDPETNVYRLFHGHGEGLAGLDVDRFAETVLIWRKGGQPVDLSRVQAFYREQLPCQRLLLKEGRRGDAQVLWETGPRPALVVREQGLRFALEPMAAQNAGLFMDARPARRWLLENSRDRRIANLFAYTGSLGVAAIAGSAASVEHVDLQGGQLKRAQANHQLNGQLVPARDFQAVEVGRWLRLALRRDRRFDGIILDPPPRMPSGRARFSRPRLYRDSVQLLSKDGWLMVFFNRRGSDWLEQEKDVFEAAGRDLEVIWRSTSGQDFPEAKEEDRLRMSVFRCP